jgi:hypothetical protein
MRRKTKTTCAVESNRRGAGHLMLVAALVLFAFASPARAEKVVIDVLGPEGTLGGQTANPTGIAINQSGAGGVSPGAIYITDGLVVGTGARLNRVQRFAPDGDFERAWGYNVAGRDEHQRITVSGATGGTFTLSFGVGEDTTANIPYDASSFQITNALAALPSIGAGNVLGQSSSSAPTVRFTGALSGTDVDQLTANGAALTGPSPSVSVSTLENGSGGNFTGFEICTVAASCQGNPTTLATANGGQLDDSAAIAVNQTSGDVYVLSWGSRRIDQFDADGNFIRAWGTDVVVGGGTGFEICTVATECKKGVFSSDGGSLTSARSLAIDSAGNVWVGGNNHRFDQFDSAGNFIAAYGWDVDALGGAGGLEKCTSTAPGACQRAPIGSALGQFSGDQFGPSPYQITIDSAGNIYAVDAQGGGPGSPSNNRIQRFNSSVTSASVFGIGLPDLTSTQDQLLATPDGHLLLGVEASGGNQLLDLDASGAITETSLAGAGIPSFVGLARNEATGTIYATTTMSSQNPDNPNVGILVIDDGPLPPQPGVELDPITTFDDSSATFSGTVDPGGLALGSCKFQYSTDQVTWVDVPELACDSFDPNGGPQAVSEEVTGLETGGHYFVRLVATRPYNPAAVGIDEEEVTLPSLPPVLSDLGVVRIADTSASLVAKVRPRSQSTNYHFEYGLTPGLGSSTAEAEIVGSAEVIVSQQVTGLSPDTDYHFKLTATNVAGTTESGIEAFHTRAEPLPNPDDRAYEQVTPPAKNFNDIGKHGDVKVAENGQAVTFPTISSLENPPSQVWSIFVESIGRRGLNGWRAEAISPPICFGDSQGPDLIGQPDPAAALSSNIDRAVLRRPDYPDCPVSIDPAAPPQENLYLADLLADPPEYELLTPQPAIGSVGPSFGGTGGNFAAADGDWSHVLYTSARQQTADAPAGSFAKLYQWHEGALTLLSKDTSEAPFTTTSGVAGAAATNTVSEDGSRIFFSNAGQIYMREFTATTYEVAKSECTSACGSSATKQFRWATPDGNRVLFSSAQKLINGDTSAGEDLYLYAHGPNPLGEQNLTLLSKDNEPADGSAAGLLGVLGMSEDGETVYFAASSQLVLGGPTANGPKLYRWLWSGGSPTVDYLGTLAESGDDDNWGASAGQPKVRRVTADGTKLLIETELAFDPLADGDEDLDVYRWNEEGWACASCQLPSQASAGDSTFAGAGDSTAADGRIGNAMSADGARVFFATADALLDADTNDKGDLYEWHEGTLSLISSGIGTEDVEFTGIGLSGHDAFFLTRERLVGWDTDDNIDLYDARIGGGFPEPPPTGAPCEGEACRGASTVAPVTVGAGSAVFEGPGNRPSTFAQRKGCPKGKRQVRRKGKARCVKPRKRNAKRDRRAAR